jgi:peptide-methionine (S)-S-oxide reductase
LREVGRNPIEKVGLGGGCHWCTEGVFQALKGVEQVEQGFIQSDPPSDTWAEGVIVHFDPAKIDLKILIEVHLRTHTASKAFVAAGKYRSAVYVFEDRQQLRATDMIAALQCELEAPVETRVLPFRRFKPSDERYQNYYATDPQRPFCRRFIDPKLEFIRQNFAEHVSTPSSQTIGTP